MAGVKGRSGPLTKIEQNYGRNLGLRGLKLLQEEVDDPSIPRSQKLKALEPYLLRLIPQIVRIEDDSRNIGDFRTVLETARALQQLIS